MRFFFFQRSPSLLLW